MSISPYVFYSGGKCAEAFEQYQSLFGGELSIMRMSDVPDGAAMPGAPADSVMHASLTFDGGTILGSDDPTGDGGPRLGMSLAYTAPDAETAERVFAALADGGEVQMPLAATFWSAGFGMCLDRYGVPWMIDTAGPVE